MGGHAIPKIAFPNGFEGSESLPRTKRRLVNCWKSKDNRIIPRPGIPQLNTTSLVARGSFEWNDGLYNVASTSLIKITNVETGAFSTIGTISGSANIKWAIGFNEAVILVPGGAIYTLDSSDTLTLISGGANFVASVDVTNIDGIFVYIPSDGSPAFFSDVGDAATVQAESFFDAEELPDKNNSCFNLNRTLYIGGTDSFQLFRNTGASPVPFQPVTGASIRNGYIGGKLEAEKTFYFIGRKKDQAPGIFAIGQGEAPKISNERIDLILSTYSEDDLADAIPGRFVWRGYDVATFALRNDSFAFLDGNWFILDTIIDEESKVWGGGFITEFNGVYYTAFDDKIGKLAKVNTDYGERTTKIIGFGIEDPEDDYASIQSIHLGLSQGFNTGSGTVALRMSKDNVIFGPEVFIDLGLIGNYADKLEWNNPGGLGMYHGFAAGEIYCTDDIDFSADYLLVNAR